MSGALKPPPFDDASARDALAHHFQKLGSISQGCIPRLPDAFEDEWIKVVLTDRSAVRNFSQRVERAKPPMELRYLREVADDRGLDWEYTERVLSSRDLDGCVRAGEPIYSNSPATAGGRSSRLIPNGMAFAMIDRPTIRLRRMLDRPGIILAPGVVEARMKEC
jgi:hypothetical protein